MKIIVISVYFSLQNKLFCQKICFVFAVMEINAHVDNTDDVNELSKHFYSCI